MHASFARVSEGSASCAVASTTAWFLDPQGTHGIGRAVLDQLGKFLAAHKPALAAGLAGAVVLARRRGLWQALLAPPVWLWLYVTGVHAVIVVGDRYHMPATPWIALLAGLALASLLETRDRKL